MRPSGLEPALTVAVRPLALVVVEETTHAQGPSSVHPPLQAKQQAVLPGDFLLKFLHRIAVISPNLRGNLNPACHTVQ
jgi:hypothetical protein